MGIKVHSPKGGIPEWHQEEQESVCSSDLVLGFLKCLDNRLIFYVNYHDYHCFYSFSNVFRF